jgi:hypothetical protein
MDEVLPGGTAPAAARCQLTLRGVKSCGEPLFAAFRNLR